MNTTARVMLAEQDELERCALAEGLRHDGHDVIAVPDGNDVKSYIDECFFSDAMHLRVDVLVADLSMPGMGGLQLLRYLHDLEWELPIVVLCAQHDATAEASARDLGASAVLDKPVQLDRLEAALAQARATLPRWPGQH